jgi:hypothetical protein
MPLADKVPPAQLPMFARHSCRRRLAGLGLGLWFLCGVAFATENHIVSRKELQRHVISASQSRRENRATLERFFSSDAARRTLQGAGLDSAQVVRAVSVLSDEELARLAERARQAQSDFAAGALTNQQLTYIVIALGTAVFILIILAA